MIDISVFLENLENSPYDLRARQLVDLGRQALTDADSAAAIHTLEAGDLYQRRLALLTCPGSRNADQVQRALGDPSRTIRRLAISMVPALCNDEQIQNALKVLAAKDRLILIQALIHPKRKRYAPVDAYLEDLAAADADALRTFVSYGSAELVAKFLPDVLDKATAVDLQRLARRHPILLLDVFQQQADRLSEADQRLNRNAHTVIPLTIESQPQKTFDLIRSLSRHLSLAEYGSLLNALLHRLPRAIANLVLSSNSPIRLNFEGVADRLEADQLIALVQRNLLSLSAVYLARLAPAARAAVYAVAGLGWRDSDGIVALDRINVLPRDLRAAEGRRHLALPILATQPEKRLQYATYLPWAEAMALIDPYLRDPEPTLRAVALTALIGTVRYERQALPDLITILLGRRFEQDPVRQKIFQALQALPPSLWRSDYLPSLSQIIRDALDAGDLSGLTMRAIGGLIVRIFPLQPDWGSATLAQFIEERSAGAVDRLDRALNQPDIDRLITALIPTLERWTSRERAAALLGIARMIGERLRYNKVMTDFLTRAIPEIAESSIALQMLALLIQYQHSDVGTLIADLLQRDPGWGTQAVVYNYLSRHRQDLLTPHLGQHQYKGRFTTGDVYVVPFFDTKTLYRWSASQQRIYAESLYKLIDTDEKNTWLAIRTIWMLAVLIYIQPDYLIALSTDARLPVRETAIRSLGGLQAGLGVPTLIAALEDDRARFAIYALRAALMEMSASAALDILRRVPFDKLTVAKEVVRLIGDLRTEDAYRELLTINGRDLHRDVRIALLRALWNYLEKPEVWDIIHRAAYGSDRPLATATVQIPDDGLSSTARERLLALMAGLIGHADVLVQLAALQRCTNLPINDIRQLLLEPLLKAIDSPAPDIIRAAAFALFQTYRSTETDLIRTLIARIITDRQRLSIVVTSITGSFRFGRTAQASRGRAIISALASDPATATLRTDLIVSHLPVDEVITSMQDMAESHELHADALRAAMQALHHNQWFNQWAEDDLIQLEAQLMISPDRYLRRLALAALLAAVTLPSGWTTDRRARLDRYRADPAPLVAEAAQFTFPPPL